MSDDDWIALHVDARGICWEWLGWMHTGGYGGCQRLGENMAHRVIYRLLVGPIPDGLDLDHLCRNRGCVNPDHLEPVTRSENLRRSPLIGKANALKTHCVHGHERTPENTYRKKDGRAQCRICMRTWAATQRAARRAAA